MSSLFLNNKGFHVPPVNLQNRTIEFPATQHLLSKILCVSLYPETFLHTQGFPCSLRFTIIQEFPFTQGYPCTQGIFCSPYPISSNLGYPHSLGSYFHKPLCSFQKLYFLGLHRRKTSEIRRQLSAT